MSEWIWMREKYCCNQSVSRPIYEFELYNHNVVKKKVKRKETFISLSHTMKFMGKFLTYP